MGIALEVGKLPVVAALPTLRCGLLKGVSTSPISKLRAADDERRQAKRNSLADKLTVEAKTLADLKVEKAAVDGERRTVEGDLGPMRYLARCFGAGDQNVLRWFTL
jgi:hypothetical protein